MKKEKPAPKDKNKESEFTATEVGAMLGNLTGEIKAIAESHGDLDKRLGDIEVEIHGNSEKLSMLNLVSGLTKDKVTHLDNRVSLLDKKVSQLDEKVGRVDQKVSHLDEKVGQLDQKVSRVGEGLKSEIRELGNRLTAVETRR